MAEICARLKYHACCLFLVDGTWDMGADFHCSAAFPLMGFWANEKGTFKTLAGALAAAQIQG